MTALVGFGGGCGRILGIGDRPTPIECANDQDCLTGTCSSDGKCVTPNEGAAGASAGGVATGGARSEIGGMGGTPPGGTGGSGNGVATGGAIGPNGGGAGKPEGGGAGGGSGEWTGGSGGGTNGGSGSSGAGGAGARGSGGTADGGAPTGGSPSGGTGGWASGGSPSGGTAGVAGGTPSGGTAGVAGGTPSGGTGGAHCLTISPWPPPAPCREHHYDVELSALGGTGGYTWTASSLPDGLTLSQDGRLYGTATEPGRLTVRVEDGTTDCAGERTADPFAPRDTCWLAYVADEQVVTRLFLYDPILRSHDGSDHKLSFPSSSEETAPVIDFAFSPDGRFLAYRLGGEPERLMLLVGPEWTEQELGLGQDSIVHFAWSPDSSLLAVAFEADGTTYLGGVRVPRAADPTGAGGAGGAGAEADGVAELIPVEAQVESALSWVGGSRATAFVPAGNPYVHLAEFAADDVLPEVTLTKSAYSGPPQLAPSSGGFFAVDGYIVEFVEFPTTGAITDGNVIAQEHSSIFYPPHSTAFVAPGGRHTARIIVEEGTPAAEIRLPVLEEDGSPLAVAHGCSTFLAWAQDEERFACLASPNGTSELHFYDFGGVDHSVHERTLAGMSTYTAGNAASRRRGFSAKGSWFAFTFEDLLFTAILEGTVDDGDLSARLSPPEPQHLPSTADPIDLAFSPDERWLLDQRPDGLWLHRLDPLNPWVVGVNAAILADPDACMESFLEDPEDWCGRIGTSDRIRWSSDSQFAVFRTAAHDLQLVDPDGGEVSTQRIVVNAPCVSEGVGRFAFQP
ncbi:MAG: hypothetical protein JW751_22785 [Polyangiaceae bacterium]|nr:hypothetical protein [Polyangiaceae bacterium]